MHGTRARSSKGQLSKSASTANMYAPLNLPPAATPAPSSHGAIEDDAAPPSAEEIERLTVEATAREQQAVYVEAGLKVNMDKLIQINKAHMDITNLIAQESRALADQALYTTKMHRITTRLAELDKLPNAIKNPELREEYSLLTDSQKTLRSILAKLPEQLVVVRRSLPLAFNAAQAVEATANDVLNGMMQWRQLAANSKKWKLENDQVVFLGPFETTGGEAEYGDQN